MEAQILAQAKGINGTLQLLPDRIRIQRDGWVAGLYGRHAPTELLLEQVASVEFNRTAAGWAGYLAFHDGDRENYDDFCVSFLKPQEHRFEALYQAIEARRAAIEAQIAPTRLTLVAQEEQI